MERNCVILHHHVTCMGVNIPKIPTYGALANDLINDTTFAESLRKSMERLADAVRIHSIPFSFAPSSFKDGNSKLDCNRPIHCNSDRTRDNARSVSENSLISTRRSNPCDDNVPPTVPMNSPRNIRTIEPLLVRVRRGLTETQGIMIYVSI
jgi:hypothetical protein